MVAQQGQTQWANVFSAAWPNWVSTPTLPLVQRSHGCDFTLTVDGSTTATSAKWNDFSVYCRTGYHGAPIVAGNNSGDVTITAQSGHTPRLRKLTFANASNWVVTGFDISPLHAGATAYDTGTHVSIPNTCSDIAVMNCRVRSAFSVTGWLDAEWPVRTGKAFSVGAPRSSIIGNIMET